MSQVYHHPCRAGRALGYNGATAMRRAARLLSPLLFLFATTSWGCGVFAGSSPTPTPTATPTVTPTATATRTPTPSATPTPQPRVVTPAIEMAQGGVAVLRIEAGGASATASFNGRDYDLLASPGGFWGVLGVDAAQGPGDYTVSITVRDEAGAPIAQLSATAVVDDKQYPVENITLPPGPSSLLDANLTAQELATRAQVFASSTRDKLWSGPFILPVAGPISSPYGIFRSYNGGPVGSFHTGTDFPVDEGTPVAAANSGVVAFAGALPVRGNSVIIDHGGGVFSAYHHLSSATVHVGQSVAQGDLIAYSGATGLATGPHLHWEIIINGVNVDPVPWTYEDLGP